MAVDEDSAAPAEEPLYLNVLSAFLAMEPLDSVISLARECHGGLITCDIQRFFWEKCVQAVANRNASYVKKFLKKLIHEVESEKGEVLDEVYEEYALYMSSSKADNMDKDNVRVSKVISFLFPKGFYECQSCPNTRKLAVTLQCSLNMLEGDTGCSIWPSSLFLSEFVLSFPDIFTGKLCFEVGSGVGLVGICLEHVKAAKVILTDGDLLTLANMKLNLEMNHLNYDTDLPEQFGEPLSTVKCVHLPWETASGGELQDYNPDIILGADIIYDPSCLPHLIRLLATLLRKQTSCTKKRDEVSNPANAAIEKHSDSEEQHGCVAYIACVIRNINTFDVFLALADEADLSVADMTGKLRPFDLLPYMHSYDRSSIRLFSVSSR